jgi:branched-chain amino acid transport system substrate-binding protein
VARVALTMSSRPQGPAESLPPFRGVALAVEQLASGPEEQHLTVDLFDDHNDLEQVRRDAERIAADDRYLAVIGPMGSGPAMVSAPIFDAAGLLQISPCASHPDLCRRGYRTFARLVANEEDQGRALARIAREYLGAHRAAIVLEDDVFGRTVAELFTAPFAGLGGEVVARCDYAAGASDFAGLAGEVADSRPDLVLFAVHPVEGAAAALAVRRAGVRVPFLGTDAVKPSFYLGGGDEDGPAYHTHTGADMRRLPSAAAFRDAYAARWPVDSTYSPEAYDALLLVAAARAAAGSDTRAAVLDAFRGLDPHDGVTGRISFTPDGERRDAPIGLYIVERDDDDERTMRFLGTTDQLLPS